MNFCRVRDVDLDAILKAKGFQKVAFLDDAATNLVDKQVNEAVDDAVEQGIVNDDLKKQYLSLANQVVRLYKAILPDPSANEFAPIKTCLTVLAEKIRNFTEEASIDAIMGQVGELLDESIATKGYVIHPMNVYTDPRLLDVHGALDSLPALSLDGSTNDTQPEAKATGTDNATARQFAPGFAPKSDNWCKPLSIVGNSDDETAANKNEETPRNKPFHGVLGSGPDEIRTHDLCIANAALSQLSYRPFRMRILSNRREFS